MMSPLSPESSVNDWADYWRYEVGVNVIPADTKNKRPIVEWKQYQNVPISEEQHNKWKQQNTFSDGMAIVAGKVWHSTTKKNLFLILVDLDNRKAIEEFCTRDGVQTPLSEIAKSVIVEQHKDQPDKAHIIFYATHAFPKKSSDVAVLSDKLEGNDIPAIEVKGSGEHGLLFCTPSPHKNGQNYEIIGTIQDPLDLSVYDQFEQHIDSICRKWGISYLDSHNRSTSSLTMADLCSEDATVIEGHNRHEAIMRFMESLLWNNPQIPTNMLKKWSWEKNLSLCKPPLNLTEFDKQWNSAVDFITKKVAEGGGKKHSEPREGDKEATAKDDTDAGSLIDKALANCKQLFTDQYNMPFAQALIKDHYEILALNGEKFKRYIVKLFYDNSQRIPGTDAQNKAVQVLIGKAEWENPSIPLHLRVCRPNQSSPIYYDLTNESWQQIEIRKGESWRLISAEHSPVLFNRYGQIPQTLPEREYDMDILDRFIALTNIKNDNDKLLAKIYLITAFIPEIAHPIYSPFGGAGAAKGTLQTMIKRVVDPAVVDLLTVPTDKNEFIHQLGHNFMTFYDNLKEKRIPYWLPQDVCSAVTGAGNIKRVLFTDDDDFAHKYKRCIGFNGINVAMTESDIASRSITVKLETIPKEQNRTDTEIYAEFEALKPALLGFIFDTVAKSIDICDSIQLTDLPRLGDFAVWGEAVARVLGYKPREFLDAYYENIGKQNAESVENDQVGEVIIKLCDSLVHEKRTKWIGSIADCRDVLTFLAESNNIDTKARSWPKIPNQVSRKLNEIKTSLLDGFKIKVTIERLTAQMEVVDELDPKKIETYRRNTRLVTIEILEPGMEEVQRESENIGSIGSLSQSSN